MSQVLNFAMAGATGLEPATFGVTGHEIHQYLHSWFRKVLDVKTLQISWKLERDSSADATKASWCFRTKFQIAH